MPYASPQNHDRSECWCFKWELKVPQEVDEVLFQHSKVLEAITVGVPDTYCRGTIKSFLVLKPRQTATDKEISFLPGEACSIQGAEAN